MKALWLTWLLAVPVADAVPDFSRDFKNELKTEHFVFHYGDDISTARDLARFSDGFIGVVDRNFFKAQFEYPIHAYILRDRDSFKEFLRTKAGIEDPPNYGIYLSRLGCFVTYEDSGFGTFAHEIMHPLLRANLPHAPEWACEGVPSFFEKGFGYWEGKDMVLHLGYQNPWRIREMGDRLGSLDLKDIVTSPQRYGTSEKRLVSVFLYRQGKFKTFLDLVRSNRKNGYGTFVEAAFGRKFEDLQPLWSAYLRDILANRDANLQIPATEVLPTKDAFTKFMRDHRLKDDPNLAPVQEKAMVSISGEVKAPGTYSLRDCPRLSILVEKAGGYTEVAHLRKIAIRRGDQTIVVNGWEIRNHQIADVLLAADDTVIVSAIAPP